MNKYYFNLDKVSSIHLRLEEVSDYRWFDEIKPQPRYFLGFKIGSTKGVKAGWGEYDDSDWRKDTEYFDDYEFYRVDLDSKTVFVKPKVVIYLNNSDRYSSYFDTDQEAQQYVDDLVNKSNKNFQVIVVKS